MPWRVFYTLSRFVSCCPKSATILATDNVAIYCRFLCNKKADSGNSWMFDEPGILCLSFWEEADTRGSKDKVVADSGRKIS